MVRFGTVCKSVWASVMAVVLAVAMVPLPAWADTLAAGSISTASSTVGTQAVKLTQAQTALGLFKYIRKNSEVGSAAYVDAQCAIDILNGTVTAGVDYPIYQTPSQGSNTTDTEGNSNAKAYKNVKLTDPGDAASLKNMDASLNLIDSYNAYRKKENKAEGTKLATNIGTNCRMLAISIVQCDYSRAKLAHSRAFSINENLSWGYSNPFDGWYTEEKANYKAGNGGQTGHYLNIVDANGTTTVTGFAVCTSGAMYGICHEQSFYTAGAYYPANITYTTAEFRSQWFDKYYKAHPEPKVNTLKASPKSKTVNLTAKVLKSGAKGVSNIVVSKAVGTVTYANVSTNAKAKKFKVSQSTGKVTVTKKLGAGSYPVVVKVKAAGNSKYAAKTVNVKFTVKVS